MWFLLCRKLDDTGAVVDESLMGGEAEPDCKKLRKQEQDLTPPRVEQKRKNRCFKCSKKLELANQAIGKCLCGKY